MIKTILLAGIVAVCAAAQPPNVVRVIRNGTIAPYVDGKAATNVLGMSSLSGLSETWLVELHDSFGSLEDLDKTIGGFSLANAPQPKALIGIYLAGLSYRAEQAAQNLPKTRYFDVVTYRIRPDTEADFAKLLKARRSQLDSINLDRPDIVYQIVSGAPVGTYIVLTPLPSLRVFDESKPPEPAYAAGDQAATKTAVIATDLASEHLWFRVDPRLSHVSDGFASADNDFWRP